MKKITLPCDIGDLFYLYDPLNRSQKLDYVWELEVKSVTYDRKTNLWHIVTETTKKYLGDWHPFEFDYAKGKFFNIRSCWGGPHEESSILRKTDLRIIGKYAEKKRLEEEWRKINNGEFD